jgi:sugar phosphate isomerase/epimerase
MRSCITISLVPEARGGPFVYWDDLDRGCGRAAELGFDAVEVFAPGAHAIDVASLRATLSNESLQLAAVGTGAGWLLHKFSLTDVDANRRSAAVEFVASMINVGGQFGAAAIIGSMQGRCGADIDRSTVTDYLRRALDTLAPLAARHGVPLIYEPLNRYETNLCNTLADGCRLLESLETDNVMLLADLFHMNIEEADLAEALQQCGEHVGHVHFADSNRQAIGCGHIQMEPVMAALRSLEYAGYLSAEILPLPDATTAAERTIRSFRHWTTVVGTNGPRERDR